MRLSKSIPSSLLPLSMILIYCFRLNSVSNTFYNLIPHRGATPPIKTSEQIKEKSSLLEALTDIEIATRLMKQKVRPLHALYLSPRSLFTPTFRVKMK